MKNLIKEIREVKKTQISEVIKNRIKEFESLRNSSNHELFKELCFCILTANFNAKRSILIQKEIGEGFVTFSKEDLTKNLSKCGHRFPSARAEYILEARKHLNYLKERISSFNNQEDLRDWVSENVKGLGYKESSHFLRNIGFNDLAIIDFHILDLLERYNLIEKSKCLTKNKYREIESVLRSIAKASDLTLAELDLYLWYMETGTVLK